MDVTPIGGTTQIAPLDMNLNVHSATNDLEKIVRNLNSFSSNEAFMADVIKAFQSFGFSITSALAGTDTRIDASSSPSIQSALNDFVHSLQVALDQADHAVSSSNANTPNASQGGFNTFIEDLLFLIGTNNNNALLQSNDMNSAFTSLQSNFQTFLNLLTNSTSTTTVNPALSDFLSMMLINLQTDQMNQNSVGTSFTTLI